jgi:nicotinate phosphoribosyltransferase
MTPEVPAPLLVDLYELTMLHAYRRSGMDEGRATFSLFVRSLPDSRSHLVAAGLDDALGWLESLRFGDEELAAIERLGLFPPDFIDHLAGLRFTGDVRAVPEGTVVFAGEPLLEVDAPIGQGQLAETYLLNQLSLQTMLATTAARCRDAARGRAVVDFAIRRSHGIDAAMKLARVGRLVGLDGTSNVAGADRYGLPASGTMAHAYVQSHADELQAFRSFAAAFGDATVLLVDTYVPVVGIERAVQVAAELRERGQRLRGIRIDSGDLAELAALARRRFDEAGCSEVQVHVSGDLDELRIDALLAAGAPIDGFGVGTALGVSKGAPSLNAVYKLTELEGRLVRKTSSGKQTWPGRKQVWRSEDWSEDVLSLADEPPPGDRWSPLLVEVMRGGERTPAGRVDLADAHARFEAQRAALPDALRHLTDAPEHRVRISESVRAAAAHVDAALGMAPAEVRPGG